MRFVIEEIPFTRKIVLLWAVLVESKGKRFRAGTDEERLERALPGVHRPLPDVFPYRAGLRAAGLQKRGSVGRSGCFVRLRIRYFVTSIRKMGSPSLKREPAINGGDGGAVEEDDKEK